MEYPFKDLLPLDEVLEREGYYKDWTHIDTNTFHQISELVKFIREKGYGADTREALAQALERVYHDAAQSGNANMEVSMARKHFKDLASRLDASDFDMQNFNVNWINKNLGKLDQTFMTEEFLQQMAGNTPINSVPANDSVSNEKLTNDALLNVNIPTGTDLNDVNRSGYHTGLGSGNYTNVPDGFDVRQMFSLEVIPLSKKSNRFYLQVLIDRFEPHKRWIRRMDVVSQDFGSWKSLYQDFSNVDLSVRNLVTNGTDLDTIKLSGTYLVVGGGSNNYPNAPSAIAGRSFMLKVEVYQQAGNFRLQYATPTDAPNEIYVRYNQDGASGFIKTDWVRIGASGSGGASHLAGKVIYNFGDSVFGNAQSADSVSGALATITGATTYNVGFGGCQMSQHATHWDAFSMYRIADAITTGDYSLQDAAIQASVSGMPSYFNNHLTRLKNADWSKVDFITIGYGTNDYTAGDLLDNPDDKFDTATHGGALRYAIETILTAYPHIKILIVTSTYRFWFNADNLTFKEDSDEVSYNTNQDTLDKFAENAINIAKEYKLPAKNLYHDLGINKFNRMQYFDAPDGTHHNAKGRRRIAESIAGALTNY